MNPVAVLVVGVCLLAVLLPVAGLVVWTFWCAVRRVTPDIRRLDL
jgi:hypothetical protein